MEGQMPELKKGIEVKMEIEEKPLRNSQIKRELSDITDDESKLKRRHLKG
jgi:hypothetical protein